MKALIFLMGALNSAVEYSWVDIAQTLRVQHGRVEGFTMLVSNMLPVHNVMERVNHYVCFGEAAKFYC